MPERSVHLLRLGPLPYGKALELQWKLHTEVVQTPPCLGTLLFTSHAPPVITFGHSHGPEHLLVEGTRLREQGIELQTVDRGGSIPLPSPGQLVLYPILHLERLGCRLRHFVATLEEGIIEVLALHGLTAGRHPDHPIGVWVDGRKICSLGLQLVHGVTLHGLALNVTNDLSLFDLIQPCGLSARGVMTSVGELLGVRAPSPSCLEDELARALAEHFELVFINRWFDDPTDGGRERALSEDRGS